MNIFVASSTESLRYARDVGQVLRDLDCEPMLWNDVGVSQLGDTIIDTLERMATKCKAAVVVAGEDDLRSQEPMSEWTPRDNVLYELGYFSGRFTRRNTICVRAGNPRMPSDLDGVLYIQVPGSDGYQINSVRATLMDQLEPWVRSLKTEEDPSSELPKLAQTLTKQIERLRRVHGWTQRFDVLASELLNGLAESLHSDKGINHELIENIARFALPNARGIYAVDVLGPSGWLSPTAYRYLAVQIREYIRRNVRPDGWQLSLSARLADSVDAALSQMNRRSATLFDNNEPKWWQRGEPHLEFCRVLLWSEEELLSQIGESVIAIHEAFNVPLFFVNRMQDHPDREVDYIFFANDRGVEAGFYGLARADFETHTLVNGRIPGVDHADAERRFWELMRTETPLFAIDARHRLLV